MAKKAQPCTALASRVCGRQTGLRSLRVAIRPQQLVIAIANKGTNEGGFYISIFFPGKTNSAVTW